MKHQQRDKLTGICPVLVSPMREDCRIDVDGLHKLVDHLIRKGAGGFWALGSASEDINLTADDRRLVIRETLASAQGRVPVIAGIGLASVDQMLRELELVADQALHGVHVLFHDPKLGDARLISELARMADRSPHPIWLYHNPKRGKPISLEVLREICTHDNVHGIKVGGYDLTMMTRAIMMRRDDFEVIGAGGGQFFSMLCLGSVAHTASSACCWIEDYVELYKAFCAGELWRAREIQFTIIANESKLPRTDNGEYAAEEKYVLKLLGICDEYVNASYRRLTEQEKAKIQSLVSEYRVRHNI